MRYAELMALLSIFDGTVDKLVHNNLKCKCCFWIFNSKSDLSTVLVFSFSDTFKND